MTDPHLVDGLEHRDDDHLFADVRRACERHDPVPPGMVLGNEVWIVTDFRELEKGIADYLATLKQLGV